MPRKTGYVSAWLGWMNEAIPLLSFWSRKERNALLSISIPTSTTQWCFHMNLSHNEYSYAWHGGGRYLSDAHLYSNPTSKICKTDWKKILTKLPWIWGYVSITWPLQTNSYPLQSINDQQCGDGGGGFAESKRVPKLLAFKHKSHHILSWLFNFPCSNLMWGNSKITTMNYCVVQKFGRTF